MRKTFNYNMQIKTGINVIITCLKNMAFNLRNDLLDKTTNILNKYVCLLILQNTETFFMMLNLICSFV